MKIGLDAQARQGRRTGLGVYTENLVRFLARESDNGFQFHFYEKAVKQDLNTLHRWYWENVELPKLAGRDKIDLLHIPAFAPPFIKTFKLVVTVHDLIGMIFPNQWGWPSRFYWGKWLPFVIKRADAIVADSENTKRDIVRLVQISEKKIHVIYPSGHEAFSSHVNPEALSEIKARLGILERYVLFVGTLEPRKNLRRTLEAFARFLKKVGRSVRYQLVVAGSKGFAYGRFFKSVVTEPLTGQGDVICTDYVSHEDLNLLYCGAEVFVFPSLYEGFGIPILEAMAAGTPVLASHSSSIPEVAGEAALYIDPHDTDQIASRLEDLARDSNLRKNLVEKGFEQIKKFSWGETARQTMKIYRSLG